jgi:hypothetical protein
MSTPEDIWTTRLHAAVDDHPGAFEYDVSSYVAAGRKRARRNRAVALLATAAAAAVVVAVGATIATGSGDGTPQPVGPVGPKIRQPVPATNGWVAVDTGEGGDISLVRPGEEALTLAVVGSDTADEACPAWSPDGTRLMFGRVTGSSNATAADPELVIVPISQSGEAGEPTVIGLDGFDVLPGFDVHPCATWAPDGRRAALAAAGEVWVVDTQTKAIRRLPDLRPSDLEWRPGTDELAIAGDLGADRGAPTLSTPVTVYSVSTGKSRALGSVEAAHITWAPDGETLAYTGGETDSRSLLLVDADGRNARVLVRDLGEANHGIGPVWSPGGDRIAYQRLDGNSAEGHEVVLVDVSNGNAIIVEPPLTEVPDEQRWYPSQVSWSPDGTTLLYAAWTTIGTPTDAVVAVPVDTGDDATVVMSGVSVPEVYSHQWAPLQMWGGQPG